MKQTKTQKLTSAICGAIRTLDYENRRISSVLSALALLQEDMERKEATPVHIDMLQGIRFALIDNLSELEEVGENLYDAI